MTKFLKTEPFAECVGRTAHTIRILHSKTGQAFGIKPLKVGRFLLWPVDQVNALLGGTTEPTHKN